MGALDRLAARLTGLERQVSALSTPQLAHSSIIDGAIEQVQVMDTGTTDTFGNPVFQENVVARIGAQEDGTNTLVVLDGPTPPAPTAPNVTPGPGFIAVEWDGGFVGGVTAPLDFLHVAVHVSPSAGPPTGATLRATITALEGASVVIGDLAAGSYYVSLVTVAQSGKWSVPSGYDNGAPGAPGADPVWVSAIEGRLDAVEAAAIAAQADATTAIASADGKTTVWYSLADPVAEGEDGDTWYKRDGAGVIVSAYEKASGVWSARTIGSSVIDSLTAGKITTGTLDSATTITVGNPASAHVELGASSLQVFRPDPDGVLTPTISVGGATADSLIILDPATGGTIAGFDPAGDGVSNNFTVNGALNVGGFTLEDYIWELPWGTVASYRATSTRPAITTTEYGLFEINTVLPTGRIYRVVWTGNFTHGTTNGSMRTWLRVTTDGTPPEVTSTQLMMGWHGFTVANLPMQKTMEAYFHVGSTPGGTPVSTRVLVSAATLSGTAAYYPDSGVTPGFLVIEDTGPMYTGFMLDGAASGGQPGGSGPGVQTYTTSYVSSWTRTWRAGSVYSGTTDAMQGTSSYGAHTASIGFPTQLYTDLNGSTVKKLEVYLYANHWYYGSGGTAILGVHGSTTVPATFSYSGSQAYANWGRGVGKWVTLPTAWYAGFASGANRGITVGGGASSSSLYYGRFNGTGASSGKPAFRATYTK